MVTIRRVPRQLEVGLLELSEPGLFGLLPFALVPHRVVKLTFALAVACLMLSSCAGFEPSRIEVNPPDREIVTF